MSQPDKEKSNPSSSSNNLSVLPSFTERRRKQMEGHGGEPIGGTVCGENKSHHARMG